VAGWRCGTGWEADDRREKGTLRLEQSPVGVPRFPA